VVLVEAADSRHIRAWRSASGSLLIGDEQENYPEPGLRVGPRLVACDRTCD